MFKHPKIYFNCLICVIGMKYVQKMMYPLRDNNGRNGMYQKAVHHFLFVKDYFFT